MTRISITKGILLLVVPLLMFPLLGACDDDETKEPTTTVTPTAAPTIEPSPQPTSEPAPIENVTITVGNLTDKTGPAASAVAPIDLALEDMAEYYNEQEIIPGIEFKTISYDGQFDPANDIPGYEWLKERGADVIYTSVTSAPLTLRTRADEDQIPIFGAAAAPESLEPPGYVFSLGTPVTTDAYTLLKWMAENDWDYETQGPARVGGAGWVTDYDRTFIEAMEEYCSVHPDQFEWVGGYLTNMSFTWGPEVEALKDCDYVYVPGLMLTFVKEYRAAGYTAKVIASDAHLAFFGIMDASNIWEDIDGALFIRGAKWWNETGTLIDLTKEILYEKHPDDAEEIMRQGLGYIDINFFHQIFNVIAKAADEVGPENVDGQSIYNAAQSWSGEIDGVERWNYSSTKRTSLNYYAIYEARMAERNVFRLHEGWLPMVYTP